MLHIPTKKVEKYLAFVQKEKGWFEVVDSGQIVPKVCFKTIWLLSQLVQLTTYLMMHHIPIDEQKNIYRGRCHCLSVSIRCI